MSVRIMALLAWAALAGLIVPAAAQKDGKAEKFPEPPEGFDKKRDGIDRGKLETVSMTRRRSGSAQDADLHATRLREGQAVPGALPAPRHRRGRERVAAGRHPDVILDNLFADGKARADDRRHAQRPGGQGRHGDATRSPAGPAFAAFEDDLLKDVIPFVEKTYSVKADRECAPSPGCRWAGGRR